MTHQAGFTLPELLVAIALMAIMAVLSYRGIDGMQRSVEQTEASAVSWQNITRALDRLAMDAAQPGRRPLNETGEARSPLLGAGSERGDSIVFYRRPMRDGEAEQRISYRLTEGRLELLIWPVNQAPAGPATPEVHTVLEHVSGLHIRYLGADMLWSERWPGNSFTPLPKAIKFQLDLADGGEIERIVALP